MNCPTCGGVLLDGQALCSLDVIFLARRATRAVEHVHARDPGLKGDSLVVAAIAFIESGHDNHRAPYLGCPFCMLPGRVLKAEET